MTPTFFGLLNDTDSIQASLVSCFKDNSSVIPFSKYSCQSHTLTVCMYSSYRVAIIIYQSHVMLKRKVVSIFAAVHCVFPSVFSHVRECLKLDQDDKECFAHYKQVKKLSKQLDSAEELISEQRC